MSSSISAYLNTSFITSGLSREFYEFLMKVAEAHSKEEEDDYVIDELSSLRKKISQKDATPKQMKEYITRLIYCNMLGNNVDFGVVQAIMLAQSAEKVSEKRIGYLACSLLLNQNDDLNIMLVNTIQRDLKSRDYLEICAALNALSTLFHSEMISAVLSNVVQLLEFPREIVRKKAIVVLHRLHTRSPEVVDQLDAAFRSALMDKDPSVVGASLGLWNDLIKPKPSKYVDLLPHFIKLLQQIIDHKLHKSFDYHGVPAPWMQINLLRILAKFLKDSDDSAESVVPVVLETLKKAEHGVDAAFAIIFECICTLNVLSADRLSALIPDPNDETKNPFSIVNKFLRARNHNLRYLGFLCLERIDPQFWMSEWIAGGLIAEGIGLDDERIIRKALALLETIVSKDNIITITDILIIAIQNSRNNLQLQVDLVTWMFEKADKHSAMKEWHFKAIVMVLIEGGISIDEEISKEKVAILRKDLEDDSDGVLRKEAVELFFEILNRRDLRQIQPPVLGLIFWTIGEYSHLSTMESNLDLVYKLTHCARLLPRDNDDLPKYLISAITKCVKKGNQCPVATKRLAEKYKASTVPEVQKEADVFLTMIADFTPEQMIISKKEDVEHKSHKVTEESFPEDESRRSDRRSSRNKKRQSNGAQKEYDLSEVYSDEPPPFSDSSKLSESPPFSEPSGTGSTSKSTDKTKHRTRPSLSRQTTDSDLMNKPSTGTEKNRDISSSQSYTTSQKTMPNVDANAMLSSLISLDFGEASLSSHSSSRPPTSEPDIYPANINTKKFREFWRGFSHEKRLKRQGSLRDCVDSLEMDVGLTIIEAVGKEFIAAGQIGQQEDGQVVLVHGMGGSREGLELTIRGDRKQNVEFTFGKLAEVLG